MKRTIMMLLAGMALAGSAAEASDTVAVITGATGVTVVSGDGGVTVKVDDSSGNRSHVYVVTTDTTPSDQWDIDLPFLHKKQRRFSTAFMKDVYIGFAIPVAAPDGMRQSVDYGFPDVIAANWRVSRNTAFSIGAGIAGYRVNLGGGRHFEKSGGALTMVPDAAGMSDVSSSLTNFAFTVPLRFQQRICGGFGFSLGAIANINTYASATTSWKSSGTKYKNTLKGLEPRPLTWSFEAVVGGYNDVGLYVRYTPRHQFRHGYGPDYNLWAAGLFIYM